MGEKIDDIFDKEFTSDIVCHFEEEDGTHFGLKNLKRRQIFDVKDYSFRSFMIVNRNNIYRDTLVEQPFCYTGGDEIVYDGLPENEKENVPLGRKLNLMRSALNEKLNAPTFTLKTLKECQDFYNDFKAQERAVKKDLKAKNRDILDELFELNG